MANINKKIEQLEKIKEEIALEKQKIEQELGKQIITALDLDYDQLTKKEIKTLANQFKNNMGHSNEDDRHNDDELKTNVTN